MPELGDFVHPVPRARAGVHTNNTVWALLEERKNLTESQLSAIHGLPRRVDAVDLELVLREIEADGYNVFMSMALMASAIRQLLSSARIAHGRQSLQIGLALSASPFQHD